MGQACEMCGRSIRGVYHNEHYANPFGQSGHVRGGGDGWIVPHRYGPDAHPSAVIARIHSVMTCGHDICVWRARHHGVPGAKP